MTKNTDLYILQKNLFNLYRTLRKNKKTHWDRILPFSELIIDRWEKAKFTKAKYGASIYDSSLIFGKVSIGKNTWIGPYTILDGSGGRLNIGDFCSISSGVQIYTHNSVNWALTGGKSNYENKSVSIGNFCYIGPYTVISLGTKIGKCCVIGAHSFVDSKIPSYSIAFGIPAKIVGKVKIIGKKVQFNYFKNSTK